jgi:hypothetical protein
MTGFIPPEQMDPRYLKTHYALARMMCVMYAFTIAMIALLYSAVPHPVWAMPLGIACIFGSRASLWCMRYRRLLKSRSIEP